MFVVRCPECGKLTEIPPDAVGPTRSDPWNVIHCDQCPESINYDDEDVFEMPDSSLDPTSGLIIEG